MKGKRCLITGGSRGLGRAICLELSRRGAKVAFTYSRNDDDAKDAQDALGGEARVFKGSVADAKHVKEVVSTLVKDWGGIDVLINNAGITQVLPIALIEEDDWDQVMDTNVKGAFLFSRAVVKHMIKARGGQILSIGSFASERIIEAPVHFAAAKSALRGFSEALSREVGRYNVRVNVLSPGLLDVGLAKALPQHRVDEYLSQCGLGELGTVAEVAKLAAFLVSDDSSFMTGAKIGIDGGL